jgi:hypothetical protein
VTTRPFLCKSSNRCDIRLYDERGAKRRTSRCQACRYRACLDQGMSHGGPRVGQRGGRHNAKYTTSTSTFQQMRISQQQQQMMQMQSNTNSFDSSIAEEDDDHQQQQQQQLQEQIQLPKYRNPLLTNGNKSDAKVNGVKDSNGSSSFEVAAVVGNGGPSFMDSALESLSAADLRGEVGLLQSRIRELECALREKEQQCNMRESQESTHEHITFFRRHLCH